MKIIGVDGLTDQQVMDEIQKGAKFVIYQYCISILILTFKRPSEIYFIRSGESRLSKGLLFSLVTFLLGWWGIPWGPIYSISSLFNNFAGGKDITQDILANRQVVPAR